MMQGKAPPITNKTLGSVAATKFASTSHYSRGGDLTNNAASKILSLSFWLKIDSNDRQQILTTPNLKLQLTKSNFGRFSLLAKDASGDPAVNLQSEAGLLMSGNGWTHVAASLDSSQPGSQVLVVNGEVLPAGINHFVADNVLIDFSDTDYRVSAYDNGTIPLNGCLSQFYVNTVDFIDFREQKNRRKFIDRYRKPVFLGVDGYLPSGSQPIIFVPNGDFSDNRGYGGAFTPVGNPSACVDAPPV